MDVKICVPDTFRNYFEQSWLRRLLSPSWRGDFITWADYRASGSRSRVVLVSSGRDLLRQQVAQLVADAIDFGVILLSDEMLVEECEFADQPRCRFVFRNYVHPKLLNHPKVRILGLGCKTGFLGELAARDYWDRTHAWNFVGTLHHEDRQEAVRCFESMAPGFTHRTSHFNASDYLGIEDYSRVLGNSIFTLCPYGHVNMDTFRLYEALEAGSIPVTLRHAPALKAEPHYWHYVFRGDEVPFIVAETWALAAQMARAALDSQSGQMMRHRCITFWDKWKATWRAEVNDAVCRLALE